MWVAIPLDIVSALLVMKLAAFGPMKEGVAKQFLIFRDKHTWALTALYIVTFGSFIGFSMALPLSITVIFGISHVPDANGVLQHTLKNPNAPSAFTYAWIGPFVGAAVRPIGGWISDKVGGSIVTQVISVVMVVASVAVGYVMLQAYRSATPEQYFPTFLGLFVRAVRRQRHRQRLDLPHHRRDLRPHSRPARCWAGPRPSPPTAPSSRRSSSATRSRPARRSSRCTALPSSMRCAWC